jgi:hypothetical protein
LNNRSRSWPCLITFHEVPFASRLRTVIQSLEGSRQASPMQSPMQPIRRAKATFRATGWSYVG